ncbi:MAG: spore germination protein GerW family protein [Hyphomicrobiales bacterium]
MSPDLDAAFADAENHVGGAMPQRIIERLAEKLGGAANARAVYGDPVERDGITIIPVAKVSFGLGGGGGRGADSKEGTFEGGEGGGGGGGLNAKPVGYIEIRNGQATFVRFKDPAALVPVLIGGAIASWIFARALRTIFR